MNNLPGSVGWAIRIDIAPIGEALRDANPMQAIYIRCGVLPVYRKDANIARVAEFQVHLCILIGGNPQHSIIGCFSFGEHLRSVRTTCTAVS